MIIPATRDIEIYRGRTFRQYFLFQKKNIETGVIEVLDLTGIEFQAQARTAIGRESALITAFAMSFKDSNPLNGILEMKLAADDVDLIDSSTTKGFYDIVGVSVDDRINYVTGRVKFTKTVTEVVVP